MKTSHISLLLPSLAILGSLPAAAQFDQTISVEGRYTPEVIRLDRINTFPRQEKFALETTPLSYDAKGIPAAFAPKLYSMSATGWRDTRKISNKRGYLDIGAGSWLNSTLSAGYRFIDDENSVLGLRFQHNSTSLWKPGISPLFTDTRQYRYDEALGIYGSHIFKGSGRLDAAVDYHIGNFNYYALNPVINPAGELKIPTQTLNDISARIGWQSAAGSDAISWNVGAGARYFGYRRMYDPSIEAISNSYILNSIKPTRETDINLKAGVTFPLAEKSTVGIDLNADAVMYSGADKSSPTDASESIYESPGTYGLITLTPYYRFSIDRLNIRLGADVDIAANARKYPGGDRYDTFRFAPDVMLDYDAGGARFFLHLLGGNRLHTLATGSELNYYQQPFILSTAPTYTPLDGELGVSFGSFSGFSAGLKFAYRISRGEYLGGWYQELLNCGRDRMQVPAGLPETYNGFASSYSFLGDETCNLHGYSLGADLSYDLGKIFKIAASGYYSAQNGEKGYFNGLDRPRWVADISAQTNPWKTLKFMISYNYRGVRQSYIRGSYRNDKGFRETFLTSSRLPDITNLNFGVSYSFTDAFSIWLQADNLLNRKVDILPGLLSQGITFAGGVALIF
ncbi:MAG: TonB-dependent receptor [Muribaculaceae bacterium]|nr:TonB-dependent receptor [Muribaculaceae bacterium]